MQINTANTVNANNASVQLLQSQNQNKTAAASAGNSAIVEDIVEISGKTSEVSAQSQSTRKSYSADIGRMREIWTEHDRHVEAFRKLVQSLMDKQAEKSNAAGIPWDFNDPNAMVDIDDATRTAAEEAIGEGGPFSVESVATRLLDFAVAISGGDPSRIEVLRNAVERGFEAAERQWGGKLPDISQRTREAVMEGFDQWQKAGDASAIALLNSSSAQ